MTNEVAAFHRRAEIAMADGDYSKVAACYRLARQFVRVFESEHEFDSFIDQIQCEEVYREEEEARIGELLRTGTDG